MDDCLNFRLSATNKSLYVTFFRQSIEFPLSAEQYRNIKKRCNAEFVPILGALTLDFNEFDMVIWCRDKDRNLVYFALSLLKKDVVEVTDDEMTTLLDDISSYINSTQYLNFKRMLHPIIADINKER